MIGASRSLALDQGRSQALTDDLVPLVERTVLEGHDAGVGAGAAPVISLFVVAAAIQYLNDTVMP
jgi:hypothetical protein